MLIWDGENRVDLNVFGYEYEFLATMAGPIRNATRSFLDLELAMDEMPRGIGRVINLGRDLLNPNRQVVVD